MSAKIFSSHIFIFPFTWDYQSNKKEKSENFMEFIEDKIDKDKWINLKEFNKKQIEKSNTKEKQEFMDNEYNEKYYFYDNVRNALYDSDENSKVRTYYFDKGSGKYKIEIIKEIKETFSLDIDKIELKMYESEIGFLSFYLNNTEKKDLDSILNINDYGRRIYPQFKPIEKAKSAFLADSIKLDFGDGLEIKEVFSKEDFAKEGFRISKTILGILGDKFTCEKEEIKNSKVIIQPLIDDRMFTLCWYGNDDFSNSLKREVIRDRRRLVMRDRRIIVSDPEREANYSNSKDWYKYMFIDNGDECCKNKGMLKEQIKNNTYARWSGYGTLYGITRYSLMVLTSEDSDNESFADLIRKHINTQYCRMAQLALMQRATALKLSNEAAKLAKFDEVNDELDKKVKGLNEKYIKFKNSLYFTEVTAQEQGIEMYDILFKNMKIEREVQAIENKIDLFQKYVEIEIQNKAEKKQNETNSFLNYLAVFGTVISIPTLITGFFGMNVFGFDKWTWYKNFSDLFWIVLFSTLTIIISYIILSLGKDEKIKKIIKKYIKMFIIVCTVVFLILLLVA
ncbi:hypothetical protein SH2C18_48950 [Clostridium sediminicola]|uniref:CorA family divalent cation transporter n=1 Tax=Clostridium sediminicola TaxID=3114879 RepID=UPI0031F24EF9